MEKLTRYCIEDFTELIYYNSNMVHKRRLRSLLGRIRHQRDYDVHIIEAIPILEHLLEKPFYLKEEDNHEFYVIYDPSLKEDLEIEESESYIYFILSDDGYVKIGLSNDPEKRLKSLQTATAHELKIIHQIPGNQKVEHYLHTLFKKDRFRGEWFIYSEMIKNFIIFGFSPIKENNAPDVVETEILKEDLKEKKKSLSDFFD